MNKKGFVFVETIITIVFLAAAMLILYSSYRSAITEEKEKIYYDDISYLYRNYYLADFLINKTEIHNLKSENFNNKYTIDITSDHSLLFSEYQESLGYPEELKSIEERFNVNKMLIVSDDVIVECTNGEKEECKKSYEGLSDGLSDYIKTMDIGTREINKAGEELKNYFLVTEYREKEKDGELSYCGIDEEDCAAFYVNLKLDINKNINNADLSIGSICKGRNLAQCLKDNYDVENTEDSEGNKSGIFYHDGDGKDSGEGEKEAKDNSYRYGGINVKNYVCFGIDECSESKNADNLYRIIGVFGNNLKIIKANGEEKNWNSTETITKAYDDPKYKNMLISKEWYIDGMEESMLTKDALGVYQEEMKGSTTSAKQGIMYVSEYLYGASPKYWETSANNYGEAKNYNWLYKGLEWTVSKEKGTENAYAINEAGNVGKNNKTVSSESRISLNLKDTVILVKGEGTKEDPYILADIGIVISDLSGEEDYYDVTANVEAYTDEGKIVEYYYSIYKDGKWSDWVKDSSSSHKFDGLDADTEYPIKVKVLNNRGNYSEEKDITLTTKYEAPSLSVSGSNDNGNIDDDTWTNKDLTVKGNTSGGKGEYDVYYCRTTGTSCEPDTKASSMTDSTEGEENICFKTISRGARKTSSAVICYHSKLDKQVPSCTATHNGTSTRYENGVPIRITCTEKGESGIKTCNGGTKNPSDITSKTSGKNTFTVIDNAGNSNTCSANITKKTYYNSRTRSWHNESCSGGYTRDCKSWNGYYSYSGYVTYYRNPSACGLNGTTFNGKWLADCHAMTSPSGQCECGIYRYRSWVKTTCNSYGNYYCSSGYTAAGWDKWGKWSEGYKETSCSASDSKECQSKVYYSYG